MRAIADPVWMIVDPRRCAALAVLAALMLVPALAPPADAAGATAPAVTFWVSPNGDDAAAGTQSDPFRSLERARSAVRSTLRTRATDVTVNLLDGTHRLSRTFALTAADFAPAGHTVTYRAAPGTQPVISGALRVKHWSLYDPALNIQRAKVPVGTQSRQLYINGRRAIRARGATYPNGFVRTEGGFTAPDESMASWGGQTGIEAVTLTQWKMMRCPVASVQGRQITMQQPCWTNVNVFPYLWSFQTIVRFENAYELLDSAGEWYLDSARGWLYYIPRVGEDLDSADVELPVIERLVDGHGTATRPIANLSFRGLTFSYGTWLTPSGPDGYASDQGGFHLVGPGHTPNLIGHAQNVARTPGNVRFTYAHGLEFVGNDFRHLGGAGLDLDTGSQHNAVVGNRFEDISGAGIELGGVQTIDHHPTLASQTTRDNRISNNLVTRIGIEFQDAPGVCLGFTTRSTVDHNEISHVPWAGIAIGWGWGLLDPGGFLGLPGAVPGQWGNYTTPTTSRGNRILNNRIKQFLGVLWDGGAIYTLGQQGASATDGELIAGNVASAKRRLAGGNTFYTDGGSRYVTLADNVSFSNPVGVTDFGPCGLDDSLVLCWVVLPYGSDRGGCRPYGDLVYRRNMWQFPEPYWTACPYEGHPVNVVDDSNTVIAGKNAVAKKLLRAAGRQGRFRRAVGAGLN
jgi:hypothetical protein